MDEETGMNFVEIDRWMWKENGMDAEMDGQRERWMNVEMDGDGRINM